MHTDEIKEKILGNRISCDLISKDEETAQIEVEFEKEKTVVKYEIVTSNNIHHKVIDDVLVLDFCYLENFNYREYQDVLHKVKKISAQGTFLMET